MLDILLCFRDRYLQCYCAGRGAHRSPVMDVPVIIQLQFLHSYENVLVPQIAFLDSAPTSSCTAESCTYSANCASTGDSTAQFLVWLFTRPLLCCDSHLGLDSAENCGSSACVLGHGLPVVVQRQVPGCRDSAENCGFSAVGAG